MRLSNGTPEPRVNPLAPVEELARWLIGATTHFVVGLVIGLLVARLMRSRHLHWSWAAVVGAIAALMHPAVASIASTPGTAALSAALWGRRWHREDIDAGNDLAAIAGDRRSPLNLVGDLIRASTLRHRQLRHADGWFRGDELILGCDQASRVVSIPLGGRNGGTHTLVVGATGSGKTVTQTWTVTRAIEHGMGAIVVDPKGDPAMRDEVRRAAHLAARAFIEWSPAGFCVYNPYARGTDTEIADKALAGERFTEPHYLRQAQRYLGHVVRALRGSEEEVSLAGIVEHMDPARLECLVRNLPQAQAEASHAYLDSLTARQQADLAGVRDRLAILSESDIGMWLDPRTHGAERFQLLDAVRSRAVVYFNLESDSRPLLTQMLGAAIVQDLQTTVAALQGRPVPTLVVIDEFSAIAAEQVVRLFGRARSAGFSLLLSTQEISDLRLPGREKLLEHVIGNLSVLIAHRQVVPDSAQLIASLAGTRGAWRSSRHGDGKMTRTRTHEGVLDANEIVSLGVGRAAVIVLAGGPSVRFASIFSAHATR